MVAIAIAVSRRNAFATAVIDCTWAIAHATCVQFTHAIVFVIANTIVVFVGFACTATFTQSIEFVAFAIAGTIRDVVASAFAHSSRAIAHTACIQLANAVILVVANTIVVFICFACTATFTQGVEFVAFAIAGIFSQLVASTFVDRSRAIAHATLVEHPHTRVQRIANAIGVYVRITASPANAKGVDLVAIAIAIALGDVGASTGINRPGAIAHVASVKRTDTNILVVANAIAIRIGRAIASTDAQGIQLVAIAVTILNG